MSTDCDECKKAGISASAGYTITYVLNNNKDEVIEKELCWEHAMNLIINYFYCPLKYKYLYLRE